MRRLLTASTLVLLVAVSSHGARALATPDPLRDRQWGLDSVHADDAWSVSRGDGVVVAVVDSGVDPDHPDLQGQLVEGRDFVGDGAGTRDLYGHGTHVAGIAAAATANGTGISGCAPGARIMPVRVLDSGGTGTAETIAAGVEWAAANGADVINLSLGEEGIAGRLTKGGPLNAAIRQATAQGAVVVAAAGNGNRAGQGTPLRNYRTGVPVMIVNAVDGTGTPTAFTNFGDLRAVSAPGAGILSTVPTYPTPLFPDPGSGYAPLDGTSMATPFVSCAAALLLALGLPPEELIGTIQETAVPGADARSGAGTVDLAAAVAAAAAAGGAVEGGVDTTSGAAAEDGGAGSDRDSGLPPALWIVGAILAGLSLGFVIGAVSRARGRK